MPLPERTEENREIMDDISTLPIAEYTFGICYYGHHNDPFETFIIRADNIDDAWFQARKSGRISIVQTLCHVKTDPNPQRVALMIKVGWISEEK